MWVQRTSWALVPLCVVQLPLTVVLVLTLLDVPAALTPFALIAVGIGYSVLCARLLRELPALDAAEIAAGATMPADTPHVWVPFLLFGSVLLRLAGIAWLAFVDWRVAAIVAAVEVLFQWSPWRRTRRGSP
jgi:hypothetical protein